MKKKLNFNLLVFGFILLLTSSCQDTSNSNATIESKNINKENVIQFEDETILAELQVSKIETTKLFGELKIKNKTTSGLGFKTEELIFLNEELKGQPEFKGTKETRERIDQYKATVDPSTPKGKKQLETIESLYKESFSTFHLKEGTEIERKIIINFTNEVTDLKKIRFHFDGEYYPMMIN